MVKSVSFRGNAFLLKIFIGFYAILEGEFFRYVVSFSIDYYEFLEPEGSCEK